MRLRSVISRLIFSRQSTLPSSSAEKHLPTLASHLIAILADVDQFAIPVAFLQEHLVDFLPHRLLGPQQCVNVLAARILRHSTRTFAGHRDSSR